MKITVTYSCPQCGYRYAETIDLGSKKVVIHCRCCEEAEILILDPLPKKLVYAT